MMHNDVLAGFSKQIVHELTAEYNYLAISVYFEQQVLKGMAAYMRKQAGEEHTHAMKLLDFVLDRGGTPTLSAIETPRANFASVLDAFKHAQQLERNNTAAINELYRTAGKQNDLAAQQHLQWFIEEQVEEEKWADEFVAIAEKIAAHAPALFMLDHRIGKMAKEE